MNFVYILIFLLVIFIVIIHSNNKKITQIERIRQMGYIVDDIYNILNEMSLEKTKFTYTNRLRACADQMKFIINSMV